MHPAQQKDSLPEGVKNHLEKETFLLRGNPGSKKKRIIYYGRKE